MNKESFAKETEQYSLSDLQLIFETQRELYSQEEMALIQLRIQKLEEEEKEKKLHWVEQHIPKEIICPKCDGPNPFENERCSFCGHVLDKKKYYDMDYYCSTEENVEETNNADTPNSRQSFTFQYIISFIIPLVGFILGAILLGKDCQEEKKAGKVCIVIGIISVFIGAALIVILNAALLSSF